MRSAYPTDKGPRRPKGKHIPGKHKPTKRPDFDPMDIPGPPKERRGF